MHIKGKNKFSYKSLFTVSLVGRTIGIALLYLFYEFFGTYLWMIVGMLLNEYLPETLAMYFTSTLLGVLLVLVTIIVIPDWKTWLLLLPCQVAVYAIAYFVIQACSVMGFTAPIVLFVGLRMLPISWSGWSLWLLFVGEVISLQLLSLGIKMLYQKVKLRKKLWTEE